MSDTTTQNTPVVLVVMGVSGCGKSTVAALLASQLGWEFEEGDSLHPQASVDKMAAGEPLNDEDRAPWLEQIAEWVEERIDTGKSGLITSSALKRSYRDIINRRGHGVVFVYLAGSYDTIASRLTTRQGHFMPDSLLESQFETLEEPTADEPAITVNVGPAPALIAERILKRLNLTAQPGGSRAL